MGAVEDFFRGDPMGFLLTRAAQNMRLQLGRAFADAGLGISVEQWHILMELWQQDGLNQRELGSRCCKSKVSITKILAKLEDQGLVIRRRSNRDRRGNRVFLTEAGYRLQDITLRLAKKNSHHAVEGIDPERVDVCKDVLKKIFENMK